MFSSLLNGILCFKFLISGMRKIILLVTVVLISCGNNGDEQITISEQEFKLSDKPSGILKENKSETGSSFDRYFAKFTDVTQPILIPLPGIGKEKYDIAKSLEKIQGDFNKFLPKLTNENIIKSKTDSTQTSQYFYQKILFNSKLKCPVIFSDSGEEKYFTMCTYDNGGNLVDAILIAGFFNGVMMDAEIENDKIKVSMGKSITTYLLNTDGKFIKQ